MKAQLIIAAAATVAFFTFGATQVHAMQRAYDRTRPAPARSTRTTVIRRTQTPQRVTTRQIRYRHGNRRRYSRATHRHSGTGTTQYRRTTTTRRVVTTRSTPPPVPACGSPVIVRMSRHTRLYQPRIRGHYAVVQTWCTRRRTWISVRRHRSIW